MRGCHERRELFNARMVAGGMELGLLHALAKAMFNRPCTSPRRNQCRSGGAPMKPQGWSPNDGWFCWPGADDPAGFLRNAGVVVHITREGEPLCGATFAPDDVGFYAKERVHINCRDCLAKAHEMWPQRWPKPAEFAEK